MTISDRSLRRRRTAVDADLVDADTKPTDRRRQRHDAKLATIVSEAWHLARRDGLAAISLRELADRVDLRQPSLYAYFDSKLALYDAMFVDGNRELLEVMAQHPARKDPRASLVEFAEVLVQFGSDDVVRYQLLFQRTIPGFEASPASMEIAMEYYTIAQQRLTAAGATQPDDIDVFSALVAGFSQQQVANDPGGKRWVRQVPRAIDMFLADVNRRAVNG